MDLKKYINLVSNVKSLVSEHSINRLKKKKENLLILNYIVTRNNIMLNVVNSEGEVVTSKSISSFSEMKKVKDLKIKKSYNSGKYLGIFFCNYLKDFKAVRLIIRLKGRSPSFIGFKQSLVENKPIGVEVIAIEDHTPIAHNGCKKPLYSSKKKRLKLKIRRKRFFISNSFIDLYKAVSLNTRNYKRLLSYNRYNLHKSKFF